MSARADTSALVVADGAPAWQRGAVFFFATAMFFVAQRVNGRLEPVLSPLVQALPAGPRLMVSHWLLYSFGTALLCALTWFALVKAGQLRAPRLTIRRDDVVWGVGVGVGVSAVTAALWAAAGPGFHVDVNGWKIAGNLLSNLYEEVSYRGLVFGAALYFVRQPIVAALLSGAVFGFTHDQFPIVFQIFTALVGAAFAWGYQRTGSLVTAWIAHQVSDMLLDTFLKS